MISGERWIRRLPGIEIALVLVCAYLAWKAPGFLSSQNLLTVLRSVSMQGLIAFGMTLVIVVGEIDLSVGAAVSFAGCLLAWLTARGVPIPLAFVLTLMAGWLLGASTGVIRQRFGVPSFITTLALMSCLKGAALTLTGGFPITSFPPVFSFLGSGYVSGIPFPAIVFVTAFAMFHLVMTRSAAGRAIYAVGGNPEAARLSGIPVSRVRTHCLALTGALSALSGILLASRINSGTPDAALGWELDVIAAVIVGGTSLAGGQGTIRGTFIGVLFIGVIANGMTLLDIPVYTQYIVKGLLIFAAVLMHSAARPKLSQN